MNYEFDSKHLSAKLVSAVCIFGLFLISASFGGIGEESGYPVKLEIVKEYEKNMRPETGKIKNIKAEVKLHKGIPGLFINGKMIPTMSMMPSPWTGNAETFAACRDFAAAGINIYGDIIWSSLSTGGCSRWWLGEGKYDFSIIDKRIASIIKSNPRALIVLRIKLNPPKWWLQKNPGDRAHAYDLKSNKIIPEKNWVSLASENWEKCYEKMLRDFIRHVEKSSYANHVIGYHPGGGRGSEWNFYGYAPFKRYIDYSPASVKYFRKWLARKYKNNKSLQKAWGNASVTLADAQIPLPEQRNKAKYCCFYDLTTEKNVIDFRDFLSDVVSDNIIKSCRIVKEETNNSKLAGAFYGSSFPAMGNIGIEHGGHLATYKVIRSKYVDFMASPSLYHIRRGGDSGAFQSFYTESYILNGKLFYDEADIRTHLFPKNIHGRTKDLFETRNVFRRQFGYTLTRGNSLWWFLLMGNETYHDNNIMEEIAKLSALEKKFLDKAKNPLNDVAVIVDERSLFNLRRDDKCTRYLQALMKNNISELSRAGVSFSMYLTQDLMNPNFPDHKLYIFLNIFNVPDSLKTAIKNKTRKNNAVSVWFYAPGYITGNKFSLENIKDLTGISLKSKNVLTSIKIDELNEKTGLVLENKLIFREKYEVNPYFWVDDRQAKSIAKSKNNTVIALKEFPAWRSVYSLYPLNKFYLRALCRYAGVNVYSSSNDVFSVNHNFLMLHAGKAGEKEIKLSGKYDVVEIFSNKVIGKGINRFKDVLKFGETKVYELSK